MTTEPPNGTPGPTGPQLPPPGEPGASPLAVNGPLEVWIATDPSDIEASQALRYRVFYEEMGATASPEVAAAGRDFDRFDPICDHLLVLDRSAPARANGRPAVVGTYRLLRQEIADKHFGFYTSSEYDVQPLIDRSPSGTKFLELGRSCTHENYRTKPTIELLWYGIRAYLLYYRLDVMFGCASFTGTDPDALALPLSYLHHAFLAPPEWRMRALEERYVEMNRMPEAAIKPREAFRALPPLIRGYLRAGAYVGDGAVIDYQFNTTDVLIIFPVSRIDPRYLARFSKGVDASES